VRPGADVPTAAGPVSDGGDDRRALVLSLVTLLLIVGASAGFLRAQALKLEPSPFSRPRVERLFSPVSASRSKASATLAFTVRSPVRVKAEIVDGASRPVRELALDARWPRGRRTLQWDGRDERGRVVPDGDYQLQLTLLDRQRVIVVPTPVGIDTRPPRATVLGVSLRSLELTGSSRQSPHPLAVRYRASEPARAYLLVDGRGATRRPPAPAGIVTIEWEGTERGRPVDPGAYVLAVLLRDQAGNLGRPSEGVRVRVVAPRHGSR
jgi:hypothetical protein